MNQRGIWQLILMAREGDRQAIDELFYASYRSSYLILQTLISEREKALNILAEGYIHVFQSLEEIEQAEAFSFELNRYIIRRAQDILPEEEKPALSADVVALAQDFLADAPKPHDFDTVKSLDLSAYADEIISQFHSLPVSSQLCAFLFYYAELSGEQIAQIFVVSPDVVLGTIQTVRRAVLPPVAEILGRHDAFNGTDAESAVLWALRNTARFTVLPARLDSFYQELLGKMVESEILDTSIAAETETAEVDDIPIREMQPLRENRVLKTIFSLRGLIILLVLLVGIVGVMGLRALRAYHMRRSNWNDFTERTTLSMTNTAIQLEHYIFSTEFDPPTETETEPPATTAETEPETTETGKAERTEAVITTAKPGADFAYTENGNQITITGYNGNHATVEVPEKIDGKFVTVIGENAFFNSSITSIKLPASLMTIGKNAFHSCTGLQNITIPSAVTLIESNAFRGCTNLRSVTLPDSLRRMGEQAFYRCTSLSTITLPGSMHTIGDWAFAYCTSLSAISIPDSVTTMGSSIFYECKSLTKCAFTTRSRANSMGESMFFGCTSLTAFGFPNTIRAVPANFFLGCRSLSTVTLSNNTMTIGSNAFKDCISLPSIKIPSGTTRIEASAFQGCTSLTAITIPSGVTNIGDSAFRGCVNLLSATLPGSVRTIGSNAFSGCDRVVFHCPTGSTAEKYADSNHIEVYGRTTETTENSESISE